MPGPLFELGKRLITSPLSRKAYNRASITMAKMLSDMEKKGISRQSITKFVEEELKARK